MDSYIARLRRREQVNGRDKPEELCLFKFRKQPWSVYFKWLGPQGTGREVIYAEGQYGNMIHTLLAAGDMPLMPAGRRIALSKDNVFVRSASRHGIGEAGIGHMIERFGKILTANQNGDHTQGTLKYVGNVQRPEYNNPLLAAEQIVPTRSDSQMPGGGHRTWIFDPVSKLIVCLITIDATGHEVEYYCYDRIQTPVKLDDNDFNPDHLWPQQK